MITYHSGRMAQHDFQSGPGVKRTTLKRRTRLLRRSGRRRKTPRRATKFRDSVQLACRTRAGHGDARDAACEACGKQLGLYRGQVMPRLAYDSGACARQILRSPANGILLCGSVFPLSGCRARTWAMDPEMEERGFRIRPGADPEHNPQHVPVLLPNLAGPLITVWFTPDGTYSREDPAFPPVRDSP